MKALKVHLRFNSCTAAKIHSMMLDASFLLDFCCGIDDLTCLASEKLQIMRLIKIITSEKLHLDG